MENRPQAFPTPAIPEPPTTARAERLAREAAALRANLLKRKQQVRERDEPKPGEGPTSEV